MGQEFRLVNEDEWQDLQNEVARLRRESETLTNDLYALRWQYSHVDPNADEPESEAGPQRPHESLIWAIYHAAASFSDRYPQCDQITAGRLLLEWRSRWLDSGD